MKSLSVDQVKGDLAQIRFVPLSVLKKLDGILWSKNAKKHDIKGICNSIERYGFIDPPKWDVNLNGGNGGIVYGNGRTQTIVSVLLEAQKNKMDPPRGIATAIDTGEWCVPVKFGVDADSEASAMAAAVDHNNLTLSGSDLDFHELSKIWDDSYLEILTDLADEGLLPVTVTEDDLAALLTGMDDNDFADGVDEDPPDKEATLGSVKLVFGEISLTVSSSEYKDFLSNLRNAYGLEKTNLETGMKILLGLN